MQLAGVFLVLVFLGFESLDMFWTCWLLVLPGKLGSERMEGGKTEGHKGSARVYERKQERKQGMDMEAGEEIEEERK